MLLQSTLQPSVGYFNLPLAKATSQENRTFAFFLPDLKPYQKPQRYISIKCFYTSLLNSYISQGKADTAPSFVCIQLFKINTSSSERAASPFSYFFPPFGGTFSLCCCCFVAVYLCIWLRLLKIVRQDTRVAGMENSALAHPVFLLLEALNPTSLVG